MLTQGVRSRLVFPLRNGGPRGLFLPLCKAGPRGIRLLLEQNPPKPPLQKAGVGGFPEDLIRVA